jgi:hypothetical protein
MGAVLHRSPLVRPSFENAGQVGDPAPGGCPMETFLPPIENPAGTMMKLVYAMSRRQYGKVMTPLKVFAARMPLAFGMFIAKIAKLD